MTIATEGAVCDSFTRFCMSDWLQECQQILQELSRQLHSHFTLHGFLSFVAMMIEGLHYEVIEVLDDIL